MKELTFGEWTSTHAETDRLADMLGDVFGDDERRREFARWYATLDPTAKEQVATKIEKLKEFDVHRQDRVPYVNHLLAHRQELLP